VSSPNLLLHSLLTHQGVTLAPRKRKENPEASEGTEESEEKSESRNPNPSFKSGPRATPKHAYRPVGLQLDTGKGLFHSKGSEEARTRSFQYKLAFVESRF